MVDASTGTPVDNVIAARVEQASGDVIFQPNPGSSVYHIYYMPWQSTGGYYPTVTYPDLAATPDRTPTGRPQVPPDHTPPRR